MEAKHLQNFLNNPRTQYLDNPVNQRYTIHRPLNEPKIHDT